VKCQCDVVNWRIQGPGAQTLRQSEYGTSSLRRIVGPDKFLYIDSFHNREHQRSLSHTEYGCRQLTRVAPCDTGIINTVCDRSFTNRGRTATKRRYLASRCEERTPSLVSSKPGFPHPSEDTSSFRPERMARSFRSAPQMKLYRNLWSFGSI
jgi:hypothetical protein